MAKKKLVAIHTVVVGQGRYLPPGAEFEVDADEAASLVERGAARLPVIEAPVRAPPAGKSDDDKKPDA